jgi:hypothetical protein
MRTGGAAGVRVGHLAAGGPAIGGAAEAVEVKPAVGRDGQARRRDGPGARAEHHAVLLGVRAADRLGGDAHVLAHEREGEVREVVAARAGSGLRAVGEEGVEARVAGAPGGVERGDVGVAEAQKRRQRMRRAER